MKRASLAALLALGACASIERDTTANVGLPPLCAPGAQLGDVVVAPLTRWRADQKEKEDRAAIAQRAIEAAFRSTPCAASVKVLPIAPDAEAAAKLAQAKGEGAKTSPAGRQGCGSIIIAKWAVHSSCAVSDRCRPKWKLRSAR